MVFALFGRLVQFVVMFATVRIMTTLLIPEEYGKVSLILALVSFFSSLLISPTGTYVNRHVNDWNSRGVLLRAFQDYYFYVFLVSIFAFSSLYVLASVGLFVFEKSYAVAGIVGLSILFYTFNQTLVPSLNLLGRVRAFTWLNMATTGVSLFAASLFAICFQESALLWLFGMLVGQACVAFIALNYFRNSKEIG